MASPISLRTDHRLAPTIRPSALPPNQLLTLVGNRTLRFCRLISFRFASNANASVHPLNQLPTFAGLNLPAPSSGLPSACAVRGRSNFAFRPISNSYRDCFPRLCFTACFQLAPSADFQTRPSNSTSIFASYQIFQPCLRTGSSTCAWDLPSGSAFGLSAPARADVQPSSLTFQSASDFHRLQPSGSAFQSISNFIEYCVPSLAFEPTLRLSSPIDSLLCFRTALRLAPPISLQPHRAVGLRFASVPTLRICP